MNIELIESLFLIMFSLFFLFLASRDFLVNLKTEFLSGFCVGCLLFIGGPLCLVLIFGNVPPSDLPVPSLNLVDDISLLFYIFLMCFSIFLIFEFFKYFFEYKSFSGVECIINYSSALAQREVVCCKFLIAAYYLLTFTLFFLGGKWGGGHWQESGDILYTQNPIAVMIGNFSNVFRVVYPGVVSYLCREKYISNRRFIIYLIIYCLIELLLVNNRIIVLFSAIAIFIVYRERIKLLSMIALLLFPLVLFVNHAYPIARGLMWADGFSVSAIVDSFEIAFETRLSQSYSNDGNNSVEEMMGSAVEATNLNVMKYIFDNFNSDDFYMGKTVIVKSFSFFIPKSIWIDKPSGIGGDLGKKIVGNELLTLNSTTFGEFYGNFSYFSLVFLPIIFYLSSFISKKLPKLKVFDYCLFFCGLASVRFEFSFVIISFFCLCVSALVINSYLIISRKIES